MLTPERHRIILRMLEQNKVVKIQELVDATSSSESTIRRDLSQLEQEQKLKRVHGGASIIHQKRDELSFNEKSTKNLEAKDRIAKYAASLIRDGECIYLDAGTTTYQVIRHIHAENVTVVTNGTTFLDDLLQQDIETYIIGGYMKKSTGALIGRGALEGLKQYRFDKCFLGVNGIHQEFGYTTPDPEEAAVKRLALSLSQQGYVLADESKFNEVTFAKIADLSDAITITNNIEEDVLKEIEKVSEITVLNN